MTQQPNDGGLAFPRPAYSGQGHVADAIGQEGMSLRDWFAGLYITGIALERVDPENVRRFKTKDGVMGHLATSAYEMADAMLAERDRETS